MVRLLNGTSFEPGMYGFSSSCFPMQAGGQSTLISLLVARFFVLQLAVLVGLGDMA